MATNDEDQKTTDVPAAAPPATRDRGLDRRTAGFVAGGFAVLLVVFLLGVGAGKHHDGGPGDRFERARGEGGMPFSRGGDMRGDHGSGAGGRGMGGPDGRGHAGVMGVVTSASSDALTIDSLRGGDEVEVRLDEDTEVKAHGDDGDGDIEDAGLGDLGEGDIVAVRGDDKDEAEGVTASRVMILRDASE